MPPIIEGHLEASGLKVAARRIPLQRRWSRRGSSTARIDGFVRHGADPRIVTRVQGPGCVRAAPARRQARGAGKYDAIVALGCLIRGETTHFDLLAAEAAKGLAQVALELRRTGGFRRADVRHDGAGDRPGRWQGREQGLGRGLGRDRDGQPLPPAGLRRKGHRGPAPARSRVRTPDAFPNRHGRRRACRGLPALLEGARGGARGESRSRKGLVEGVMREREALDRIIAGSVDHWRIERMAVVDRNILRVAVYELAWLPDTPTVVVLDEAIEVGRSSAASSRARSSTGSSTP